MISYSDFSFRITDFEPNDLLLNFVPLKFNKHKDMNNSRQTFSIIEKAILVVALALSVAAIAVSALGKRSQGGLGGEVAEPVTFMPDSTIERIFGKAHYAGQDCIKDFADVCTADSVNADSNVVNWHCFYMEDVFADDIFLDLDDDVEKTTFALAVKERFDRQSFANHCLSLYQIRELFESELKCPVPLGDFEKPTIKTLEEVFPSHRQRNNALNVLNAICKSMDYESRLFSFLKGFNSFPYTYDNPFDTLRLGRARRNENQYYDKSAFVPDIKRFRDSAAYPDSAAVKVKDPVGEILRRLDSGVDFDTKCIYGIELSHISSLQDAAVEILGALIESKEYSRYLFEVWENWRALAQIEYYGLSNFSVIPNAYYSSMLSLCVNTTLRHIQTHPDDDDAILRLLRMVYNEPLMRDGTFGNTASVLLYELLHSEN